ncbi:MAG TPA: hypothetical protein VJ715_13850 [Pyrinomonadaceae bacterium]|nr:hypothetical protein [Pyrinomonadaceae bacterium]
MKSRLTVALVALALLMCVHTEIFGQKKKKTKDKRFEPVARQNLKDYEGTYVGADSTYVIEVRVGEDGELSVSSREGNKRMMLAGIKVEGARLLARKVYADGTTVEFEGIFCNRVLNGERAFGILVDGAQVNLAGRIFDRIFYRRDQGF